MMHYLNGLLVRRQEDWWQTLGNNLRIAHQFCLNCDPDKMAIQHMADRPDRRGGNINVLLSKKSPQIDMHERSQGFKKDERDIERSMQFFTGIWQNRSYFSLDMFILALLSGESRSLPIFFRSIPFHMFIRGLCSTTGWNKGIPVCRSEADQVDLIAKYTKDSRPHDTFISNIYYECFVLLRCLCHRSSCTFQYVFQQWILLDPRFKSLNTWPVYQYLDSRSTKNNKGSGISCFTTCKKYL